MDFSGCTGRVIENPLEALAVALEEAQTWRSFPGTRKHKKSQRICPVIVSLAEDQALPHPTGMW
ncbi:hypothetical protein AB205_0143220, partial [Aquarana catesbeiana]